MHIQGLTLVVGGCSGIANHAVGGGRCILATPFDDNFQKLLLMLAICLQYCLLGAAKPYAHKIAQTSMKLGLGCLTLNSITA